MKSQKETDMALSSGAEGVLKAVLSNIPVIGTLLNESLFEVRARVKQDRLNHFTTLLSQVILEADPSLDLCSAVVSERVADLTEEVFARAMKTSAKERQARLARVLIHGIGSNIKPDFEDQFMDLILELSETQIHILNVHAQFPSTVNESFLKYGTLMAEIHERSKGRSKEQEYKSKGWANNSDRVEAEVRLLEKKAREMERRRSESMKVRGEEYYGLDKPTYEALTYALIGRGLLMDIGVVNGEFKAGEILSLTSYGKRFLEFIKEPMREWQADPA